MADHYIQYPPDSTGKRVAQVADLDIGFTSGTVAFVVGDYITTPTTLVSGYVIEVQGTTASGSVYILLDDESPEAVNLGEALVVGGVTKAVTSNTGTAFFLSKHVSVGGNNPHNYQHIDNEGSSFVRFTEGPQQLDAFGISRTSQQNILGEYVHTFDALPNEWQTKLVGGGTTSYLANESSILFQVGTTSGDSAQITTNRYHRYQSGVSQLAEMTMAAGDTGKTGLIRRGGYYDSANGVYFEQNAGVINIVLRSSTSGSVVETRIPSTSWNGDKLDGTGPSGVILNPTMLNIFWFDLQWLGAGRVRFGIFGPDGSRITAHTIQNANANNGAYMQTATLPLRFETFNTAATASISQMKLCCCSVKTEGSLIDVPHTRWHKMQMVEAPMHTISSTYVPIVSIRSTALLNGKTNRAITMPETVSTYTQTAACRVKIVINANLSGATWGTTLGCADADTAATSYTGGTDYIALDMLLGPDHTDIDEHFDVTSQMLSLMADGTYGRTYTFVAKTFETTANINLSLGWIDTVEL